MELLDKVNVQGTEYGFKSSVPEATCETPAGTEIKQVTFSSGYTLKPNTMLAITFTYANTYGDGASTYPKANLSSDYPNIPICNAVGDYAKSGAWADGNKLLCYFDGVKLLLVSNTLEDSVHKITIDTTTTGNRLFELHIHGISFTSTLHIDELAIFNYSGEKGHSGLSEYQELCNTKVVLKLELFYKTNISDTKESKRIFLSPPSTSLAGSGGPNYVLAYFPLLDSFYGYTVSSSEQVTYSGYKMNIYYLNKPD